MKTKRQLANRMMSNVERSAYAKIKGVSIFDCQSWRVRVQYKKLKVIRRVKRATIRRLEREIAQENGKKVEYSIK